MPRYGACMRAPRANGAPCALAALRPSLYIRRFASAAALWVFWVPGPLFVLVRVLCCLARLLVGGWWACLGGLGWFLGARAGLSVAGGLGYGRFPFLLFLGLGALILWEQLLFEGII